MPGLADSLASNPVADLAFTAPARCLIGRGAKDQVAALVRERGQKVLILRSASVPWADVLIEELDTLGAQVTSLTARGEPTVD